MSLKKTAEEVRNISLDEVCRSMGLPLKSEGTRSWRVKTDDLNLVIRGERFYENDQMKGGGGAIDLVMVLRKCDFKNAVLWLHESFKNRVSTPSDPIPQKSRSREEFLKEMKKLSPRDDSKWYIARNYLNQKRKIPYELIDQLQSEGKIWSNSFGSVVFAHQTKEGELGGITVRPSSHMSGFRQCLGDKITSWFHLGDFTKASRMILVEAPIDALSYKTLFNPRNTLIVACSGKVASYQLLRLANERHMKISVGFDNDEPGREGYVHTIKRFQEINPAAPIPERIESKGKDWNLDLISKQNGRKI